MDQAAYRDFQLLTEIASEVPVTQRRLASKFGLALGLTNFLIRRLVRKGYVKVVNLERKRLRYLLTPKGLAAKARLTYAYLEYSLSLYSSIRTFVARELSTIAQSSTRGGVLVGTSEVAEIAFLMLQQRGVRVIAVLEGSPDGRSLFMGQPVRKLEVLPSLAYDWVVVASFQDTRRIRSQLAAWAVPSGKIITIPDGQALATLPQAIPEALRGALEAPIEALLP